MARAKRRTPPEGPRHKGWVGRTHTRNFLAPQGRSEIEPWVWGSRGALEKAALAWELDGGGPVQILHAVATRRCDHPGERALIAGCATSEPLLEPVVNATRARAERAAKAGAAKAAKAEMRRAAKAAKERERAKVREEKARAREEKRARRSAPRPAPVNPPKNPPPKGPRKVPPKRPARDDAPSARGLLAHVQVPPGWSLPIGAKVSSELPAIPAAASREMLSARFAGEHQAAGMVVIELRRGAVSRWTRTGELAWAADRRLVAVDASTASDAPQVIGNMAREWTRYEERLQRAARVGVVALDRVEHRATAGAPITPDAWVSIAYLAPEDGSRVVTIDAVALRALLDACTDDPAVLVFENVCFVVVDGRVAAVLATRGDAWTRKGSRKAPRRKGR